MQPMAPRALAPLTSQEQRLVSFEARVGMMVFVLHFITQVAHLSCPWHERWQRLLSLPVAVAPGACALLAPRWYIRHRWVVLVAFKVAFFAFPLLRQARGIQRVLDAPATPGPLGFVIDTIKIAWGKCARPLFCFLCGRHSQHVSQAVLPQ